MLSIMVKIIIILQYWGRQKSLDMKNDNLDVYRIYHLFKSQFKFIKNGFPLKLIIKDLC
jgi:hypothetical protein